MSARGKSQSVGTCPVCFRQINKRGLARHVVCCEENRRQRELANQCIQEQRSRKRARVDEGNLDGSSVVDTLYVLPQTSSRRGFLQPRYHTASASSSTTRQEGLLRQAHRKAPERPPSPCMTHTSPSVPDIPKSVTPPECDSYQVDNTVDDSGVNHILSPGPSFVQSARVSTPTSHSQSASFENPIHDDIKTIYHPDSGRPASIQHFEDYTRGYKDMPNVSSKETPWHPFSTEHDYRFTKISVMAHFDQGTTESLIKLINEIMEQQEKSTRSFTLRDFKHMDTVLKAAGKRYANFQHETIHVPFLKEPRTFDVYNIDLWQWATELAKDPGLSRYVQWDPVQLSKWDEGQQCWVRFYHEPYTADLMWEAQTKLGVLTNHRSDAKLWCFIIYTDKTRLSSFGTAKGYPMIGRWAQLDHDIRNTNGYGGGRPIGWLPIVEDAPRDRKKTGFATFKNIVWHESFKVMLRSISQYSKSGCKVLCGDGVERLLFPCVLILVADLEEQYIMAGIRGTKGLFPCPVCLVPRDRLSELDTSFDLRTGEKSELVVTAEYRTKAAKEQALKAFSLRDVSNAFWALENSDPHRATSWDRLHAYNLGLFGNHLWEELKGIIEDLGRSSQDAVDQHLQQVSAWKSLYHFSSGVMNFKFADGRKWEDLSKLVLFATHSLIDPKGLPTGYALLQCIRSYVILDIFMSFEVHTDDTLIEIECELLNFGSLIERYQQHISSDSSDDNSDCESTFSSVSQALEGQRREQEDDEEEQNAEGIGKNWNFPKIHTHMHAVDDIRAKGVTRNYNTKPNEKLHGLPKKIYSRQTNFRDFASQILKIEHRMYTVTMIQEGINAQNEERIEKGKEDDNTILRKAERDKTRRFNHIYLGSMQSRRTLGQLQQNTDSAFIGFCARLNRFLNSWLPAHHHPVPLGGVQLQDSDQITEAQYLKVNYESLITWQQETDILRCNSSWWDKPRYDHIIVRIASSDANNNSYIFAQLISMFTCTIESLTLPLALIQPYDLSPNNSNTQKDRDLGFYRIRQKPRRSSEFIDLQAVVRGVLLIKDFGSNRDDEYLVVDTTDADIFVRMRHMYPRNA